MARPSERFAAGGLTVVLVTVAAVLLCGLAFGLIQVTP